MRDYKKEYANYDGTEMVKKKRAERNKARRIMERAGAVHKGDGKDVDHKKPLSKGGSNSDGVKLQAPSKNRSFKRNPDSSMK